MQIMQTPLQITFKDTETSESLESLIRERVDRLERFHSNIVSCRVVVEVPHRSPGSGKTPLSISVEVEVPGRTLVAKRGDEMKEMKDDRAAIVNRAFEAIRRQLDDDDQIKRRQVKVHEGAPETGTIARLFPDQNYGFVEVVGSPQLYFTRNAVTSGSFDELEVGMMVHVTRANGEGPMGPQASSVQRFRGENAPS
ncbi:HPF/RaiA family ribosome-associated protein [Chelatococcus sp. GCM10030263]